MLFNLETHYQKEQGNKKIFSHIYRDRIYEGFKFLNIPIRKKDLFTVDMIQTVISDTGIIFRNINKIINQKNNRYTCKSKEVFYNSPFYKPRKNNNLVNFDTTTFQNSHVTIENMFSENKHLYAFTSKNINHQKCTKFTPKRNILITDITHTFVDNVNRQHFKKDIHIVHNKKKNTCLYTSSKITFNSLNSEIIKTENTTISNQYDKNKKLISADRTTINDYDRDLQNKPHYL